MYARSAGVVALSVPEKAFRHFVFGIEKLHETAGDIGLVGRGEFTCPATDILHVKLLIVGVPGILPHSDELLYKIPPDSRLP
ncbi:hypothetical protein N9L19_00225 [bacterium]|nr:hypothetical protein [bacterium]